MFMKHQWLLLDFCKMSKHAITYQWFLIDFHDISTMFDRCSYNVINFSCFFGAHMHMHAHAQLSPHAVLSFAMYSHCVDNRTLLPSGSASSMPFWLLSTLPSLLNKMAYKGSEIMCAGSCAKSIRWWCDGACAAWCSEQPSKSSVVLPLAILWILLGLLQLAFLLAWLLACLVFFNLLACLLGLLQLPCLLAMLPLCDPLVFINLLPCLLAWHLSSSTRTTCRGTAQPQCFPCGPMALMCTILARHANCHVERFLYETPK